MKFLFIGDIFGKKGIQACQERIKKIKSQYKIDVVIANAENCTSCRGLSIADYQLLSQAGIDYFTMGNHT
jgi:calcineurin-like phosphoesterase